MEVEAEIGVDADTEVVVHDEHLRVILVGDGRRVSHAAALVLAAAGLFLRMEYDRPSIEPDLFGLDDVPQQVEWVFAARVA